MGRSSEGRLGRYRVDRLTGWLDTNVILRYLTQDNEVLAQRAGDIIESERDLMISSAVLAECVHVLGTVYQMPRSVVIDAIVDFIQRSNIILPHIDKALAIEAITLCRDSGRVHIVDALLWAEARTSAIPDIYTFDLRFPEEGVSLHSRP